MPKVKPPTPSKSTESPFFVLTDGKKRVLVPRPKTYKTATATARRHFPQMAFPVLLQTDELDVCGGELTDISPEIWEIAVDVLFTVLVKEQIPPAAPAADLGDRRDKITLDVHWHGHTRRIFVSPATRIQRIMADALRAFEMSYCDETDFKLTVDGAHACFYTLDNSLANLGFGAGATVEATLGRELRGGKPVIYLFSPNIVDASVRLTLTREWDLSVIYPVVPVKRTPEGGGTIQWSVCTRPDGTLTERTTGLDVAYLFWEALTNHGIPMSPPGSPVLGQPAAVEVFSPIACDLSAADSVLLAVSEITPYLDKALLALGLHTEARTSFITYWLPSFLKHTHVALRFVPQAAYERTARLDIAPAPDVITRVFMLFKGVEDESLGDWIPSMSRDDPARWRSVVGVDIERALDATLFRVLEWGGMER
ncbi:hypothetical protein FB451DRAFT_1352919 [Mycena latifolia]|nr:hypothetical protein FB451DRAFT_1352919 [Mycena latifolia]